MSIPSNNIAPVMNNDLDTVLLENRVKAMYRIGTRSFPEVSTLLESFVDNGGRIGICLPCAKAHDLSDEQLVSGAEWMGGAAMVEPPTGARR